MTDTLVWIWLQKKLGYASRAALGVIRHPGGARYFYDCTKEELRRTGLFSERQIERMSDHSLEDAERIFTLCLAKRYFIITPDSCHYPIRLRRIDNPPLVLYVEGNPTAMNRRMSIAVVGTRKVNDYYYAAAQELGFRLGKTGATVVSGCAAGVDAAAQSGAAAANGVTIGVLGCGLDSTYNRQTAELRKAITLNGALVSEYPPGTQARPEHFPQRNRIISGLSLGVTVVQAGRRSGSLITAQDAISQGRDLYVYYNESNLDTLAGIHSLGACNVTLFISPAEILQPYMTFFGRGINLSEADYPLRSRPDLMPQNIDRIILAMAAKADADKRLRNVSLSKVPESFDPVADLPPIDLDIDYSDLPSESEVNGCAAERLRAQQADGAPALPDSPQSVGDDPSIMSIVQSAQRIGLTDAQIDRLLEVIDRYRRENSAAAVSGAPDGDEDSSGEGDFETADETDSDITGDFRDETADETDSKITGDFHDEADGEADDNTGDEIKNTAGTLTGEYLLQAAGDEDRDPGEVVRSEADNDAECEITGDFRGEADGEADNETAGNDLINAGGESIGNIGTASDEEPEEAESRPVMCIGENYDILPDDLSDEARRIYSILRQHSDTLDAIAILAGLTIPMTSEAMLELELYGLVYSTPGGIYSASEYFYQ